MFLYMGSGGCGNDQNPHSASANGVNVAVNPGTQLALFLFMRLLDGQLYIALRTLLWITAAMNCIIPKDFMLRGTWFPKICRFVSLVRVISMMCC